MGSSMCDLTAEIYKVSTAQWDIEAQNERRRHHRQSSLSAAYQLIALSLLLCRYCPTNSAQKTRQQRTISC